jgi:type 1 glutamine amidotransferase
MNLRLCFAFLTLLLGLLAPVRAADPAPKAPQILFLIGEPEYQTKTTLPAFAKAELEPRGVHCTFSILPSEESNEFPNFDALKTADLLFISVRRHTPVKAQMEAIRAYVAAGKPVVGIRTASHAFALRDKNAKPPEGCADWPEFDHEILGGNYNNHYGVGLESLAKIVPAQAGNPVLAGIGSEPFKVTSHLYKNTGLADWVTPLLTAQLVGRPEVEPIAWVSAKDRRRVFYTSLGAPEDFAIPQFRRLLLNGTYWALGLPAPAATVAPTGK